MNFLFFKAIRPGTGRVVPKPGTSHLRELLRLVTARYGSRR